MILSDRSQSLHSGLGHSQSIPLRGFLFLLCSKTAVHRDFQVCKTVPKHPSCGSLPQRPLRLPEGGGFGFCLSRPGSSDMHTQMTKTRHAHVPDRARPHRHALVTGTEVCNRTPSPAVSQLEQHSASHSFGNAEPSLTRVVRVPDRGSRGE